MTTLRIELNHAGMAELLKCEGVQADLLARAGRIAEAASAGGMNGTFGHNVQVGRNRARALVFTDDADAMVAEAKDRILTRAIDAGRG